MNSATSSKKPVFSIVIVTYNSLENIQTCLESLRKSAQDPLSLSMIDQEIIVVDNNSRDGTQAFLSRQVDVRTILNRDNHGFSKACNQGAEIAVGEFLIFLNPDTLVTLHWANDMAKYFQDPLVGAVGPVSNYVAGLQRLDLNLPPVWQSTKQFPGTGTLEIIGNIAGILKEANDGKAILSKILIGFCLMMPKKLYASMGGMDENLFLGNDDLDLSWRLRSEGKKLVVASDVFVFHEGQKSFKTESKTHVDNLTQESTDALYKKLVAHYGGADLVPTAMELWGIGWFSPSLPLIQEMKSKPKNVEVNMKSSLTDQTAWKNITVLIFIGNDIASPGKPEGITLLDKSLDTLPTCPSPDILVLNCSGKTVSGDIPGSGKLRILNLGMECTAKQALEIAINLLPGSHLLFCVAGVEFSTLFNHWLEKRDLMTLGEAKQLRLCKKEEETASVAILPQMHLEKTIPAYAFICRKEWLRDIQCHLTDSVDNTEYLNSLGKTINTANSAALDTNPTEPPWLTVSGPVLPTGRKSLMPESQNILLAEASSALDNIALYPDSLRAPMRAAHAIGFAGTAAELPAIAGSYKVFDSKGLLVPLAEQDLIILRVTPEMIENLDLRIRNIKILAKNLSRLVLVFNGNDAQGTKITEAAPLFPMDLTPNGIRAALHLAGFVITGMEPYKGFPQPDLDYSSLEGWTQVESVPREYKYNEEKLVSIVILGFNQVEYTKRCLESILKYTRQKIELILVDNGSHDGTSAYFHSIPNAKVIINSTNLGVAKGWNQGMRLATGEYILILNNDIIVGSNWLENMVRLAESDPEIGLVGPRSNYITGPQIVPNVPYNVEGEVQNFIEKWQKENELSAAEFVFVKGFCHLIPKRVFEQVGFYDERFGNGNFEDDDYCMRVHHHGFSAMIANDSFIHHFGSVSFKQDSVDWQQLMIENRKKYYAKWSKGPAAIHDTFVHETESPLLVDGRLAYERGEIQLAADRFLEAQANDPNNPETYSHLGVIQYHNKDFQSAVLLFLRSLELDEGNIDAAHNLHDSLKAGNGEITDADNALLIQRFPSNPVFQSSTYDKQIAYQAVQAPTMSTQLSAWKQEIESLIEANNFSRAIDAVEKKIKTDADKGACFNYLGIIANVCGDRELALEHFVTASKHSPNESDIIYNLADTYLELDRPFEAANLLRECGQIQKHTSSETAAEFNSSAEQIFGLLAMGKFDSNRYKISRDENQKGEKLLSEEKLAEAKSVFHSVLATDPQDFRAMNNLGIVAWNESNGDAALDYFFQCLAIRPVWFDAVVNAFDTALALGRIDEIMPFLEMAISNGSPHGKQFLAMQTHIQAYGPAIYSATGFDDLEASALVLKKAEVAAQENRTGDAILIYLESLKSRSGNPQALNGLGILAFQGRRYDDAFGLFQAATALHPLDQDILMNLWECAQSLRREKEVLPKLKLSLEQNPALEDIRAIVKEFA